ncbi:MAG: hypothetical protein Q8P59_09445, partial [Dehalococcoidia bacterium]|nr:hypothetical protein [Dehalococcoidia bacterium]
AGTRRLGFARGGRAVAPLWIILISYLGNALVIDVVAGPYLNMVFFLFVGCYLGLLERLKTGEMAPVLHHSEYEQCHSELSEEPECATRFFAPLRTTYHNRRAEAPAGIWSISEAASGPERALPDRRGDWHG